LTFASDTLGLMLNVPIDVCYTAWLIHTQYQARDGNDRKLMVMTRI